VTGRESDRRQKELEALRIELGLPTLKGTLVPVAPIGQGVAPITVDIGGEDMVVWVPPTAKLTIRQRFKELARHEKRRAAEAGNAANTSQLVGGSIGGALASAGVIALATATGPLALAAVIATGVGGVIAAGGFLAGHWMNIKKFQHEERMEKFLELVEELKP